MHKNQLQELAQRSCFNLPSYSCIREGPDHAPRFKATVNFNGETFESPSFCSTLRQAEHAAAEVALNTLAKRGPSKALAARVLDETGVYKNLLQETAHRAGLNLPVYTTVRTGPGHVPVYSCTVELAGMSFVGEPARTKKQAQKNAAMAAWSSLRKLSQQGSSSSTSSESKCNEEQEQVIIARVLAGMQSSKSRSSSGNDRTLKQPTSVPNLYAMQRPNCPPPRFSPEIALYQIWQQDQLLQQQYRLMALTVPPPIPSSPQIFPFMQSLLQPRHSLYFPNSQEPMPGPKLAITTTSAPSFGFSNDSVSNPIRASSTVTIQEIQDEKPDESSNISKPITHELAREPENRKVGELENNFGNFHSQTNQCQPTVRRQIPRVSSIHRPPSFSTAPVTIRTVACPTSSVGLRSHNITSVAAQQRMKTGPPYYYPARTGHGSFDLGGMRPASMAPAVRIRSVVPVCSAPPGRPMQSSSQERVSPEIEKKDTEKEEELTRASSDFCRLRL